MKTCATLDIAILPFMRSFLWKFPKSVTHAAQLGFMSRNTNVSWVVWWHLLGVLIKNDDFFYLVKNYSIFKHFPMGPILIHLRKVLLS